MLGKTDNGKRALIGFQPPVCRSRVRLHSTNEGIGAIVIVREWTKGESLDFLHFSRTVHRTSSLASVR
jgi:hypothetical protein